MRQTDQPCLPFPRPATSAGPRLAATGSTGLRVAGLFAGIGGVELGLQSSGHHTSLLCEIEPAARAVLEQRFPQVELHDDVTTLRSLPAGTDLLTGGFPCQDLSQAGKALGILKGTRSSLVTEVFRLVQGSGPPHVLLENVPFMLQLDGGQAMNVLTEAFELLGYRWAYRVVNSSAFGVPQRRERVIFLASTALDPRRVLFADDAPEPDISKDSVRKLACGFYWTEGVRGLGWAVDSVPTLKGGSTIGIPSPPAIVMPDGSIVTPDIRDAERMQGFPTDWTAPAETVARKSSRWKLVGNAVTVGVFEWVGRRLLSPDESGCDVPGSPLVQTSKWPRSAWNVGHGRFGTSLSRFPCHVERDPLHEWMQFEGKPLSAKATAGFLSRTRKSALRFPAGFIRCVEEHLAGFGAAVP